MNNLGATKGECGFKIQPRSVCSRTLFTFFCVFSSTEANPGHKESRKAVRGEPRRITKHLLYFLCLLRNVS